MNQVALTAASACAVALLLCTNSAHAEAPPPTMPFPMLPLPPDLGPLAGLAPPFARGRKVHGALVRQEAELQGVPPDVADAVAHIESSYNPYAVGGVGEVGLMQIRPQTASMLGYTGGATGLFDPETNVRYSVMYLAGAWRRADGDLCRALMKYRAGHGEERMSALSSEYCRRARGYLATIGSPLSAGALPTIARPEGTFAAAKPILQMQRASLAVPTRAALNLPLPPRRPGPQRIRIASSGAVTLSPRQMSALVERHSFQRLRKLRGAEFWAAHEVRIKAINAELKTSQLRIAAGI